MVAFADVVVVIELLVDSQSVLEDPVEVTHKVLTLDVAGHFLVPGLQPFMKSQSDAGYVHVECE